MDDALQRRIDDLWAQRLGCKAALLRKPGIHVLEPGAADRASVFLIAREGALLVRGERAAASSLEANLGQGAVLPAPDLVRAALGARVLRVVGPAALGYRDRAPGIPPGAGALRPLAPSDGAALGRLRDAVTAEEWEHASIGSGSSGTPIFGAFEDERLLAVARFEVILGEAAHLGALTHPAARGRGAGRRAVAAAAQLAAAQGLLLQYQTLVSNHASLRIADALGFASYATCLAVRLVAETARAARRAPDAV
jgi:L-amino acid N-acyltransferase YncA